MDEKSVQGTVDTLRNRSTDELLRLYEKGGHSDEGFEALRRLLTERNVPISAQKPLSQRQVPATSYASSLKVRPKRPALITIICIFRFLYIVGTLLILGLSAPTYYAMSEWVVISLVINWVSTIGLWLMKKWAVYTCIVFGIVGLIVGIIMGTVGSVDFLISLPIIIILLSALSHYEFQ